MARGQVLLVREDAGVEACHDADILPQVLVPLGGELRGNAGDKVWENEVKGQYGTGIVGLDMCV